MWRRASKRKFRVDLRLLRAAMEDGAQRAMQQELNRQLGDQMPGRMITFTSATVDCALSTEKLNLNVDGLEVEYVKEYADQ